MAIAIRIRGLMVRALERNGIDPDLVASWEELENRAVEGNVFLSPRFVLPALDLLTPVTRPLCLFFEVETETKPRLVGVGIFERSRGTKHLPIPHLRAYRSPHTFLTGLLVDSEFRTPVVQAFFDFALGSDSKWHGLEFLERSADGPLGEELDRVAAEKGVEWIEYRQFQRACFRPAEIPEPYEGGHLSAKRRKDAQKKWRKLEALGPVRYRVVRPEPDDTSCMESFLALEHMGWRGEEGVSLAARPNHEEFFRKVVVGLMRARRVVFTELLMGGEIVGSTVSFLSGDAGFAFKIGWNLDYAAYSPGVLQEIERVRNAPKTLPDLEYLDSCAEKGCFLEIFWPGRRRITSGIYVARGFASLYGSTLSRMRTIRNQLRRKNKA